MKVYNHLYRDKQKFNIFLNGIGLDREKQALVRIHSCVHSAEEISALAKEIKEMLPDASTIGCSTPGVICDGKITKDREHGDILLSGVFVFKTAAVAEFMNNSKAAKCLPYTKKAAGGLV